MQTYEFMVFGQELEYGLYAFIDCGNIKANNPQEAVEKLEYEYLLIHTTKFWIF